MCETGKEESKITVKFYTLASWVYDDILNWDKRYWRRKTLYGKEGNYAFIFGYIEFEVSMIYLFKINGG